MMRYVFFFLNISICFYPTEAQDRQPVDLTTIDGVLDELLDQITIEDGEKMDTAAVRNLFFPGARLTVADSGMAESISIDDFLVLLMDPYYAAGYEEKELYKTGN